MKADLITARSNLKVDNLLCLVFYLFSKEKMQSTAASTDEYIDSLPINRKQAMNELRIVILENLPRGFKEEMSYGMLGYVVPHSLYPPGYHCNTKLPLPFMSIASQKNFIAVYHMALYGDKNMLAWFTKEFGKHTKTRLDIGKSCIRFKKPDQIPFGLIGELASKITPEQWIEIYESRIKNA